MTEFVDNPIFSRCLQLTRVAQGIILTLIMAPSTRLTYRPRTPPSNLTPGEADTIKKSRFFNAYDAQNGDKSLLSIAKAQNIPYSTAHYWLRQRHQLGSPAYRHTRQLARRLGRPSRVTKSDVKRVLRAPKEVRTQPMPAQLAIHKINISERQMTRKIKEYSRNGYMHKAAYFKDELSPQNEADRVKYGQMHSGKSINDFWKWIVFTDEFHYNPTALPDPMILREAGTRYHDENIVARPPRKTSFVLHGAGWVNWYQKSERLIFWKDDKAEKATKEQTNELKRLLKEQLPPRPQKPRQSKYETAEEFQPRLEQYAKDIEQWHLRCPPPTIQQPRGNSMTQLYYTEHILPDYIAAIEQLQARYHHDFYLEEDGDSSHGTRT